MKARLTAAILLTLICCNLLQASNPADFNNDRRVDWKDFAVFAENWLWNGPNVPDDMTFIPGGTFQMGDTLDEGNDDETPVHTVTLDAFYMGKYEITNQQYCAFLNSAYDACDIKVDGGIVYTSSDDSNSYPYCNTHTVNPHTQIDYSDGVFSVRTKGGATDMSNHPMVMVSWFGAAAFCNWKSEQESLEPCYNVSIWTCDFTKTGFRLPTEAEWEHAARGGLSGKRYPWSDSIVTAQANYLDSGDPYETGGWPWTTPVGFYDGQLREKADFNWPASQSTYQTSSGVNCHGLYDIAGNVYEWCNDWYDRTYYDSSRAVNPQGPAGGSHRVLRGGGWDSNAGGSRSANRSASAPGAWNYGYGLRVVLDLN